MRGFLKLKENRVNQKEYLKAQAKSHAKRQTEFVIPREKLGQIVEIRLGFQPLGISCMKGTPDRVLMTSYFDPCLIDMAITHEDDGLHFAVSWIGGRERIHEEEPPDEIRVF